MVITFEAMFVNRCLIPTELVNCSTALRNKILVLLSFYRELISFQLPLTMELELHVNGANKCP